MRARVLLVGFVLLASGCGAQPPAAPERGPCADFQLDVERIWSAGVKAEIMGKGGGVEAKKREVVATKLDQLSDDWVRLRTATCRDHFDRRLITADEYRKRVTCFDDRLDQQRKLVALAKADDTGAAEALARKLESPDACK